MKINLEEAVCIVLAVTMMVLSVTNQVALTPYLVSTFALPTGLVSIALQIIVTIPVFYVLKKMPSSWYRRIIYDSTEDAEKNTVSKDAQPEH